MTTVSASQRRTADWTSVSSTACRSKVERLITFSTSAVAVSRFKESFSSWVSRATSVLRAGAAARWDRTLGALRPFGFEALRNRALTGLLPALERFITSTRTLRTGHRSGETTVPEVASSQRSKHGCLTSDKGQRRSSGDVQDRSAHTPTADVMLSGCKCREVPMHKVAALQPAARGQEPRGR
jgi:hypothetical protein